MPWSTIGGTEHATLRVAQAVAPEFESCFYVRADAPEAERFFCSAGEVRQYEPLEPSFRHPRAFARGSWRLSRDLRDAQIDLVHCSDLLAAYHAGLAGRIAAAKVLCHVRNRFDVISRRDRTFLEPVHHFAFVSQATWNSFGHRVPQRRGTVVYDGVACASANGSCARRAVLKEFALPRDSVLITMVARVAPQKDYATLARAARRLRERFPEVRFIVAGDHEKSLVHRQHFVEVQKLLRELEIAEQFVFAGYRADVSGLLEASDIFVLSTHWEGLPLAVLEAMAHGKAVVATAVDGISEVVKNGETGLSYPPGEDLALSECLAELIDKPDWRMTLGAQGQSWVRERFSVAQFAESMRGLYRQLLS